MTEEKTTTTIPNDPFLSKVVDDMEKVATPASNTPDTPIVTQKETGEEKPSEVINTLVDEATGKKPEEAAAKVEEVKETPVETPSVLSIDDLLNGNETPSSANPQEQELASLREIATEYEAVKEFVTDPLVAAFIEYRKKGGSNYREFLNNTLGEDFSGLSDEQKYKQYLKSEGITDQNDIDEQWEIFESNTDSYKAKEMRKINKHFEDKAQERVSKYGLSLKEETNKIQAEIKQSQEKGHQTLDSAINKLSGKDWNGLVITPDMAKSISDGVKAEIQKMNFYDFGNGYDVNSAIKHVMWSKYGDKMIQIVKTNALNQAKQEVLADTVKASKESSVENRSVTQSSAEDEYQSNLKKLRGF